MPSDDLSDFGSAPWGVRTYLMGVINATPDSFSGDGLDRDTSAIARRGALLAEEGADLIDIGGESTRPGHIPVEVSRELERVLPAMRTVRAAVTVPLSIDTSKSTVAAAALDAGASVVNDVSGLRDPQMAEVVASAKASLVIVHNAPPDPSSLLQSIVIDLERLVGRAVNAGVKSSRIVIDPGLGMSKDWRMNFEIMRNLRELRSIGLPILVGPSRKGMIGKVLGVGPDERQEGTAALVTLCIANGADVVRVHDVKVMRRVTLMADALARGWGRSAGPEILGF